MVRRTGQQHEQQRIFRSIWLNGREPFFPERNLKDGRKEPDRHWKTVDWKTSGQLKTLEKSKLTYSNFSPDTSPI